MNLKEIVAHLESIAPSAYQEKYDNAQLITGNLNQEISKAIICLDAIEVVIDEAIQKKANLVIAHHPIVFSGLKSLTGKNYVERTIIKAIKNDIAIYAIHTNLDNVRHGVNKIIANKIGLQNQTLLSPKKELLCKMAFFSPRKDVERLKNILFEAGAGSIGNYNECSFAIEGTGTFKGNENTNPTVGQKEIRETTKESKVEIIFPRHIQNKIASTLIAHHPYEEVAYDIYPLLNSYQDVGSGMYGVLQKEMKPTDFFKMILKTFNCKVIRHTQIIKDKIKTVAVCGGSGGFLLNDAKRVKADVFITADYKYHEFFDAESDIIIADIGHYESEQYTIQLLHDEIRKKFPNFAIFLTEVDTNPVQYFI